MTPSPTERNTAANLDLMEEERIDRLRLTAFKTNDPKDRQAYFDAASKWFQQRHYRRTASPGCVSIPPILLRFAEQFKSGAQGATMDCDDAKALSDAILALTPVDAKSDVQTRPHNESVGHALGADTKSGIEGWRPIATAPRNESIQIAGGDIKYPVTACWSGLSDEGWWLDAQEDLVDEIDGWPTHWRPLPENPPASPGDAA
jgi:hypothetical protein